MKIINSRLHGVLDYLVSLILILSPWLFGFANGGPAMWIPIILGAGSTVYSLFTKNELGLFKVFSFRTHLMFDALSGFFLAASPWIFGFANNSYEPHLVFGILELVVVLLTRTKTSAEFNKARPIQAV